MKTYLDTNILYYVHSGNKQDLKIAEQNITSINALEFLKNIEKVHTNKAKYHIPRTNSMFHYNGIIGAKEYFKKRNHPLNKRLSDYIIFDFSKDFESYALYNNESISQVINNKYSELFFLSISFLEKSEIKDIRNKFNFLLDLKLNCESITENDIELAYDLLDRFIQIHSLKDDFRNCWNDILILSKSINEGGKLITSDKLLNRFASEIYNGKINESKEVLEIEFPNENNETKRLEKPESKGYINRGWNYKIRKGN
jgi:predicted nucleic acid-binding protein